MAAYKKPGRLGDEQMTIITDPRTHPKLKEGLKALGLTKSSIDVPVNRDSSIEEIAAFEHAKEANIEALCGAVDFSKPVPGDTTASVELTQSEEFIDGPDGNKIKLFIFRPAHVHTPLPCVLYFHGGAMVNLHTDMPMLLSWVQALARQGMVAIAVDFRNACSDKGLVPFPGGLNDCAAAARWAHANRNELNINKVILDGDSGGSNLAAATALKANKEGWINEIAGLSLRALYISNAYKESDEYKFANYPSLIECDGYMVDCKIISTSAKLYDPSEENARNPLAWPLFATEEEMTGLPPHRISVGEVDPMKDESKAYARKLALAGVNVTCLESAGAGHGAEMLLRYAWPENHLHEIRSVKAFAEYL